MENFSSKYECMLNREIKDNHCSRVGIDASSNAHNQRILDPPIKPPLSSQKLGNDRWHQDDSEKKMKFDE